jgi:tetratricopeptide (TPR) repeat protein
LSLLVTGRLFQESATRLEAEVEILCASNQTILSSSNVAAVSNAELEGKVASCIARQLPLPEIGVEPDEIAEAIESGEQCLDLYLQGLGHVLRMFSPTLEGRRGEDLRLAIRFFRQVTERHASHLAGLIALSTSVIFANGRGLFSAEETVRLGLRASEAALAIDPRLPSARAARATIWWAFNDKQEDGERELREVLEQRPFHFIGTQFLAIGLMRDGRVNEAIQILQDFLEHRPDTALFRSWLAYALFLERKFESSLREAKNCAELFPDWEVAWAVLSFISAHTGDLKTALEAGSRLSRITNCGSLLALEAYGLAQAGEKRKAEELVDYILASNQEGVVHSALVPTLIALGKPYDALSCLEQAHLRREIWVPLILSDPRVDPIRSSSRFMRVRNSYTRLNIQGGPGRPSVQSMPISEPRADVVGSS